MNELAHETLRRLQRETGANLTLEDFDLVRSLVDAAESALKTEPGPACAALLMPCIRVGNVTLWRVSHGAKLFYEREILARCREDVKFLNRAFAWCMAMSKTPEILWELSGDFQAIRRAVRKWERGIGVPEDLLLAAMDRLLDVVESIYKRTTGNGTKQRADLSAWIAELARETGRGIEELLWRVPEEELLMLLTMSPHRDQGPVDADSPMIRSVRAFREAEAKIRATLEARR
jgi:hypothetical protein